MLHNHDECSICKEEFKPNERCLITPCKHKFHKDCIEGWINSESSPKKNYIGIGKYYGQNAPQEVKNWFNTHPELDIRMNTQNNGWSKKNINATDIIRCPNCGGILLKSSFNNYIINKSVNSGWSNFIIPNIKSNNVKSYNFKLIDFKRFYIWKMILLKISGGEAKININYNGLKYDSPFFLIESIPHFFELSIDEAKDLIKSKLSKESVISKLKTISFPDKEQFVHYFKEIFMGENLQNNLNHLTSNTSENINMTNNQNIINFYLWKLVLLKISKGKAILEQYENFDNLAQLPEWVDEDFFNLSAEDALKLFLITKYYNKNMKTSNKLIPDIVQFTKILNPKLLKNIIQHFNKSIIKNSKINNINPYTLTENNINLYSLIKKNPLNINIGNYNFELITYNPNGESKRGMIKIKSTHISSNKESNFYLYRSLSNCNLWRLCLNTTERGKPKLYKGKFDYVQDTFINIKLQKFIDKNIDKIPIDSNTSVCPFTWSWNNIEKKPIEKPNKKAINDESRKKNIEPFKEFHSVISHRCGSYSNYNLPTLSNSIKQIFPILSVPELIYDNFNKIIYLNFESENDTRVTLNGNIYKIVMSNLENKVILFYIKYNINISRTNGENLVNKENKYIPIALLENDEDTSINEFGLYSNYIPSGAYICKILEYTKQCFSDNGSIIISDTYSYIGDRYDNLYPFDSIR